LPGPFCAGINRAADRAMRWSAGLADGCSSALEAGPESPAHPARAWTTGPSSGRAFVANGANGPAIDDTSPVGRAMAAGAASVGRIGRAEDSEAPGDENGCKKVPQCYLHVWARPRSQAIAPILPHGKRHGTATQTRQELLNGSNRTGGQNEIYTARVGPGNNAGDGVLVRYRLSARQPVPQGFGQPLWRLRRRPLARKLHRSTAGVPSA
jgi:hypothetical protein